MTDLSEYLGEPRAFAEDVLGMTLSDQQERIFDSVENNKRTIVMSGNGPGKSYGVAGVKLSFLMTNPGSLAIGTSGSYSQYVDSVWRPMKAMHERLNHRLPADVGAFKDGGQPTLEIDDNWFAKVVSPRDPGDLEGRHASAVLVVIEEADKAYIGEDHFDSAASSITDGGDRMLVVCNPPKDESSPVADRLRSDRWNTVQFSSLDSHNVRVSAGESDAPKIPGIIDLETIREDWADWNGEEWPGLEEARRAHEHRDDLAERWYRRRAGVIPPAGAEAHRPWSVEDVRAACERTTDPADAPLGWAVDVARSGDNTVMSVFRGSGWDVVYSEQGDDHETQKAALKPKIAALNGAPGVVDAVGEGSGLADALRQAFPNVSRFRAGATATEALEYRDCWAESLAAFGAALDGGAAIDHSRLREEALVAARHVRYSEKHLSSRGATGAEVLEASSKDDIKDALGHSPDHLDASAMAAWAADGHSTSETITVSDHSLGELA